MSVRFVARRLVEGTLGRGVPAAVACKLRRPRVILAYHNVVANDAEVRGDPSLHIRFNRFVQHLRWVNDVFEIISLKGLLTGEKATRPVAAITFDDAYRGAVRLGIPWLAKAGIPSTIFICPGLGGGEEMWWDVLATASGLSASVRESALWEHGGRSEAVLDWAAGIALPLHPLPDDHRIASFDELSELIVSGAVTIGSHTMRHPNLAALSGSALRTELETSRELIVDRWKGRAVNILAYPYGLMSDEVAEATRNAGYEAALLISGGRLRRARDDAFRIPRVNVPAGLSLSGLRLRMADFLP